MRAGIVVMLHISIHALREEGDLSRMAQNLQQIKFLSTPSARRATYSIMYRGFGPQFLSTPSARRATGSWGDFLGAGEDFYPRPPRGGRRIIDSERE